MKLKRAIQLERELLHRISEVYRESAYFARTHDEHLKKMNDYVWEKPEYRKSPRWLKSTLHAVDHTLFDLLYSVSLTSKNDSALVAISIGPDGRRFGPKDDSWLKESSEYKSQLICVHVWRHRWEKHEFKPW